MNKELTKMKILILLFIFLAIGGIILYGDNNKNNFSPFEHEIKR